MRKKTVKASIMAVAIQKLIPTQSSFASAVVSALTVCVPTNSIANKALSVTFVLVAFE
jgi:hypothetical protein